MSHTHCPGSKRGHSWRRPIPSDVTRADIAVMNLDVLRVCAKCSALGEVNKQGIVVVLQTAGVAGWGANGWRYSRAENVCDKLKTAGVTLEHLGTSGGGFPKHPLARGKHRIPDDVEPMPYEWRAA